MTIPQHHFKQIEPHFTWRERFLNCAGFLGGMCVIYGVSAIVMAAILFYGGGEMVMNRFSFTWLIDLLRCLFSDDDTAPHCDCIHCQSRDLEQHAFIDKLREEGL